MKESMWGYMIITFGVISIFLIYFFQNVTNAEDHNYTLVKETTQAAMFEALDIGAYRANGVVKINSEKFIENFFRRFAENAQLSRTYKIDIYDINEDPPKVSLVVSTADASTSTNVTGENITFNVVNRIDAILETTY